VIPLTKEVFLFLINAWILYLKMKLRNFLKVKFIYNRAKIDILRLNAKIIK